MHSTWHDFSRYSQPNCALPRADFPAAALPRLNSRNNSYQGLRILNASHNFKYVSYADDASFEEFFDLSQDPHELRNVVGSCGDSAGVLEYMRARLAELRRCGQGDSVATCP